MMNITRTRFPERNSASFGSVLEEPFVYPETRYSTFLRNVGIYQTARCYIPKCRHLYSSSDENFKLNTVSGISVLFCANCSLYWVLAIDRGDTERSDFVGATALHYTAQACIVREFLYVLHRVWISLYTTRLHHCSISSACSVYPSSYLVL
jgi:hypothetical protein